MEATCEERMSIYKQLVKDCIALPDGKAGAEETLKEGEKVVSFVPANVSNFVTGSPQLMTTCSEIVQN